MLKIKQFSIITFALIFISSATSLYSHNGLRVLESNTNRLVVEFIPQFDGFYKVGPDNGDELLYPLIKDAYPLESNPGTPLEFVVSEMISVPSEKGFFVESIEMSGFRTFPGTIAPQPLYVDVDEVPEEIWSRDLFAYAEFKKSEYVSVEYSGLSRNRHLAKLQLLAASYDSQSNSIIIPESILVKIRFSGKLNNYSNRDEFGLAATLNHTVGLNWVTESISSAISKKQENNIQTAEDLSSGNWVKIKIGNEGVYRIDAAMLSNLGLTLSSEDVESVKIFGNGGRMLSENVDDAPSNSMNELPVIVNKNGDGSLNSIIFYAAAADGFEYEEGEFKHYINYYSENNYYMLTWGGRKGLRAEEAIIPTEPASNSPSTYIHRIFYEEELFSPFPNGAGRQFFGRTFFNVDDDFIRKLENLDRSDSVKFRFSVAHSTPKEAEFIVSQSSKEIDRISMLPSSGNYQVAQRNTSTAVIAANDIPSDNRLALKFDYQIFDPSVSGTGYFDYYEVHYPRSFVALGNEIGFFSHEGMQGVTEYRINNFNGKIYGFEVTNPGKPELIKNLENSIASLFYFKTELGESPRRFFISSNLKTPSLQKTNFVNLRTENLDSDVIVIAHSNFIESANNFKEYREGNSGLKVSVVDAEHIYNEFNAGLPDVTAIRDYLAHAYDNWLRKPKYIILWGDGHFDYKNLLTDNPVFIPPWESEDDTDVFSHTETTTTDDYYARVKGDDNLIDISIARIPLLSNRDGLVFLEKLKQYENNSDPGLWRTFITLVADDGPTSRNENEGSLHTNQSESLAVSKIPDEMQINKIYLVEYPTDYIPNGRRKPRATSELITSVNTTGNLLLNWIGHGNPTVWSHEQVFNMETTLPQLINWDKMFFLTAATCDFGRFDKVDGQSGAEEMFLSESGGAIGVFSAARVVYSHQNSQINQEFYENLFKRDSNTGRYPRLGDVMFAVKQKFYLKNDQKFFMLGDPTMRLLTPEKIVQIDSINGMALENNNELIRLKGLSNVKVSGRIINESDNSHDVDFNGTAVLTMLDGDEEITIEDDDSYDFDFIKYGGALNRSSYTVENGNFDAEFVIPKDISFSDSPGRLFAYAFSDNSEFAKGSNRQFIIDGISNVGHDDVYGPEIFIFLDNRDFRNGDIVRSQPLLIVDLFDSTGINSTGIGIGHRIEAWINDNPESVDLTESFFTSLEDNRYGSAQELLTGLKPGLHKVNIRAWDVFNNYRTESVEFRIAPGGEPYISELSTYPNPFDEGTTIRFRHNLNPTFNTLVKIHTIDGKQIRELNSLTVSPYYGEVEWDGRDSFGNLVPSGTYVYAVYLESDELQGHHVSAVAVKAK